MNSIVVVCLFACVTACFGYSIVETPYDDHISYHYPGEQHIPIIGKDGVPLDTPEVQVAKRQHAIAHEEAKAREHRAQGLLHPSHGDEYNHELPELHQNQDFAHIVYQNLEAPEYLQQGYKYTNVEIPQLHHQHHRKRRGVFLNSWVPPQEEHVPTIGKDGVPLDTPEVQQAREEHFQHVQHAKEQARIHDALDQFQEHNSYHNEYQNYEHPEYPHF